VTKGSSESDNELEEVREGERQNEKKERKVVREIE
jgi:hypothetical protein